MVVLTCFPPPSEGVRLTQDSTEAHVQGKAMGQGVLYIAESRVSWRGPEGQGFSLEYPAISLHAVSRDLAAFPRPCLYLMLDADFQPEQNGTHSSSEEDNEEEKVCEVRFVPDNPDVLDTMYKVMSECQVLHPDENDSFSEDDDEGEEGYFEGEEGAEFLTPEGQATLSRMEAMLDPGDDGIDTGEPRIGSIQQGNTANIATEQDAEPMDAQFEDAE